MKSKTRRTRRKRRAIGAIMKHGRAAGPTHKLRSGRTGIAHSKKIPRKSHGRHVIIAIVVPSFNWTAVSVRRFNKWEPVR